jgi:hypothetical protein
VNDPSTYWLTQTNIFLGVVVLVCCAATIIGILQEMAARHKRHVAESELDRDMAQLDSAFGDGHAFHVPGLGLTMADGGEELKKDEKEKR